MNCKNCNYNLTGSESFCPDCGIPVVKEKEYPKEQQGPQVIFSPEKEVSSSIFTHDIPTQPFETQKKEKKSRAGLYLVIVLCAVILGTVAISVTDMIDFKPVIASLFSEVQEETETQTETTEAEYNPVSGIIPPSVNYKTSIGYINGETGQALRKGPGNTYGQIEILAVGTIVHIVGGDNSGSEWVYAYIPEKDNYGWLSSAFISSSLGEINEEKSEFSEETTSTEPAVSEEENITE